MQVSVENDKINVGVNLTVIFERGSYMDTAAIAGQAMSLQTAKLQQAAGTSVMKMGMDNAKEQAQALTNMMQANVQAMEQSVNPHLGTRLNVLG